MIYTPRSTTTSCTNKIILFRGFEISIGMDDRSLGAPRPLTRSTMQVTLNKVDITERITGLTVTPNEGIRDCTGEDLYIVMKFIASLMPSEEFATSDAGKEVAAAWLQEVAV